LIRETQQENIMNSVFKRLVLLVISLVAVIAAGTAGFAALEGLTPFNALYLTFLTVSTIGYSNTSPMTTGGKLLAMGLLVLGFGIFSAVIVTTTQAIFERKETQRRKHKINTLVALYYSDVGNELLFFFCKFDPALEGDCLAFPGQGSWQDTDFYNLSEKLKTRSYALEIDRAQLPALKSLLDARGDLLLRLLENQHILEHGLFMNLLRATFHLRHELATEADKTATRHPTLEHINNDARKVYQFSSGLWVEHMQYQRKTYPALFHTSLQNNPFCKKQNTARTEDMTLDHIEV
jgi:hypothetical protein